MAWVSSLEGYRNDDGLGSRRIANLANTPQVNQRVWLPESMWPCTARYIIRRDLEMWGAPGFALKVTGEIDELTLLEACLAHVIAIHENDTPAIVNTAIAVIETIDSRVELVVASYRHHPILSWLQRWISIR